MHCLWCDKELRTQLDWKTLWLPEQERNICRDCDDKLERLLGKQCKHCGRQTTHDICSDCKRWESHPDWKQLLLFNQSVYVYNDMMKNIIAKWKYRGDYILYKAFEHDFRAKFNQIFTTIDAILVPIPLSNERQQERAFNQAEALIQLLNRPYKQVLTRVHGEKQSKKTRSDRLMSNNPFVVDGIITDPVILIDDIYTTGITLRHAARRLREHGSPEVYSFTLAR